VTIDSSFCAVAMNTVDLMAFTSDMWVDATTTHRQVQASSAQDDGCDIRVSIADSVVVSPTPSLMTTPLPFFHKTSQVHQRNLQPQPHDPPNPNPTMTPRTKKNPPKTAPGPSSGSTAPSSMHVCKRKTTLHVSLPTSYVTSSANVPINYLLR
jgi:hypothetical protein